MKKQVAFVASLFSVLCVVSVAEVRAHEGPKHAVCVVQSTADNHCKGIVRFTAGKDGRVTVEAKIVGLKPNSKHAIHIHQFGDTTDLSGKSAGGHFNPDGKKHGLPPAKDRHAGDLGNLQADGKGHAMLKLTVSNISINGHKNGIIGRAIVIHAKADDGGQPTGNAGARIGFGVIGIANIKK